MQCLMELGFRDNLKGLDVGGRCWSGNAVVFNMDRKFRKLRIEV